MEIYNINCNKLTTNKVDKRNSALELLRIVAMSMIVIHHFLMHALELHLTHTEVYNLINPPFYGGVDIFFLLSGFFLIKLTLKSGLRLIGIVTCFSVISFFAVGLWGKSLDISILIAIFKSPITNSPYWFVRVYLGLMCLSPLLNAGLKGLSNRQLLQLAIVLFLFNSYSCWAGSNECNNGYSFGQGIYLYILGNCIKRFEVVLAKFDIRTYLLASFACILVICMLNGTCGTCTFASYHSPLMVIAMLLLFISFLKLNIQSAVVNSIASASLGVYLLQDGLLGYNWLYSFLHEMANSDSALILKVACFIIAFIGLWIISWMVTQWFNYVYNKIVYPSLHKLLLQIWRMNGVNLKLIR